MNENTDIEGGGSIKLLGEHVINLAALTDKLLNLTGAPVKSQIELYRRKGENDIVVGRLAISMRLIVT